MLKHSEEKTQHHHLRRAIREKSILLGIIPPPQADPFAGRPEQFSEEQKRARRALLDFAHQRRAQYHR